MAPTVAQTSATSCSSSNTKWPVSASRKRWLSAQVERWTQAQLISSQQGRAIVGHYLDDGELRRQGVVRNLVVMGVLAGALLISGCVILLSQHWNSINRYDKTVAVFGVVAAAFAASMIGYRRGSRVMGEALALLGTLLFGGGLWLLGQIYHMHGQYPGVFFWWALGSMVTATLLKSPMCAAAGLVVGGVWAGADILQSARGNDLFLALSAAGFVLAYWQRSLVVLVLSQLGLLLWVAATGMIIWRLDKQVLYLLPALGAAYYGVGLGIGSGRRTSPCWQALGMVAVLAGLAGPSYWRFHAFHHYWLEPAIVPPMVVLGLALLIMALGYIGGGRAALRRDWPVAASALVCGAALAWWLTTSRIDAPWTQHDPAVAWWLAVACNLLMVWLATWLVVRGVAGLRTVSFFAGVAYLLLLAVLRWWDLRDDAVSGALVLLSAGLLLVITAYFWNKRNRPERLMRETSHV